MRLILSALAGACALLSTPALASQESEAGRVAEELSDPVRQAQIAGTAAVATETLLNVPVAPLARAIAQIEGYDPDYVDPDLRVGDLVDPETANAPREFCRACARWGTGSPIRSTITTRTTTITITITRPRIQRDAMDARRAVRHGQVLNVAVVFFPALSV